MLCRRRDRAEKEKAMMQRQIDRLRKALEQWMSEELSSCARQLLLELDALRCVDVVLPVENEPQLRLRMVVKPEKPLAFLLAKQGLSLPKG